MVFESRFGKNLPDVSKTRQSQAPLTDMIRSTVVQHLLDQSSQCENAAPIAYFYCQRNTAEFQRSDPTEVLRAILKQLLCYDPLWQERSTTAKEYSKRKKEAKKDGSEISELDILETTEKIVDIASKMPVTILIDALDECNSRKRHELLGALEQVMESSAHLVKVFVSSRDDVDIILRLQNHPNIYINIDDNKDDIHRFIHFEIQKAQDDRRLLKGTVSPELQTRIIENLAGKAGGMYVVFIYFRPREADGHRFLWVNLQIENLCDSSRIKIEGDLVDELDRLPRSSEHRNLSVSDVLDVCSTLVVYDEVLDIFRFAHLSVREFLESQTGYTPSDANKSMLERSLQILILNQSSVDPFWPYANLYWIFHYDSLGEQHRKSFFELHVRNFMFDGVEYSDRFETWARETRRLYLDSSIY